MATIKSFSDLQQSKKLAEILPIESADMEYMFLKRDGSKVSNVPFVKDGFEEPECCYIFIPCWSLAALLEQLDDNIADDDGNDWQLEINKEDGQYYLNYHDRWGNEDDIETDYYDNLLDACYEMILKLNELKML